MNFKKKNGWLLIDKPIGVTSNFVLQKVRKSFGNCKAGFVGTLDPLASGYLPVAIGSATKIISFIESDIKTYIFTIRWGFRTDTGDLEGDIIEEKNNYPTKLEIQKKLQSHIGRLRQKTPKYSSVKINGLRAYELARRNIPFETKERSIFIRKIKLNRVISRESAVFEVQCSAGTYIRSLAESIAGSLDTVGTLIELRRLTRNDLNKKLISLDYFLSLVHSGNQNKLICPIDIIFDKKISKIQLNDMQVRKVLTGNFIEMKPSHENNDDLVLATHAKEFVALGIMKKSNFHPKKLLVT
ncbi:MAG: tRNA pseudouridine(55) synthase TruB [Alphaproteobacteria bacterium]